MENEYDKVIYIIGFLITFGGAVFAVFKWMNSTMDDIRDENYETKKELQDFKVEVSKTYVTKEDVQYRFDQVIDLLKGLTARLDSLFNNKNIK